MIDAIITNGCGATHRPYTPPVIDKKELKCRHKLLAKFCIVRVRNGRRHYLVSVKGGQAIWSSTKRGATFVSGNESNKLLSRTLAAESLEGAEYYSERYGQKVMPSSATLKDYSWQD